MPRPEIAGRALQLVLVLGVVSLFADTAYEGARSVAGPFLQSLGATSFQVGLIVGVGELATYGLRPLSGRLTDRLGRPWLIAIPGYIVNLAVIPLLALAGAWPVAGLLFVLERVGKGVRNPPRDVMLSYAGQHMGEGWAFGLHEGLDQAGAVIGPLAIAAVLAFGYGFSAGFLLLAIPAAAALVALAVARWVFPTPSDLEPSSRGSLGDPPERFRYLVLGAGLLAAGMVAFPLISFFFIARGTVSLPYIPVLYAVGMAAEGFSALALGRLFDRLGDRTLVLAAVLAGASAPLLFTPVPALEFLGMALWGVGMGAQTSVINAVVSRSFPSQRRAAALGEVQGALGVAGLASGLAMGALLGVSVPALVGLAVALELLAILMFLRVAQLGARRPPVSRGESEVAAGPPTDARPRAGDLTRAGSQTSVRNPPGAAPRSGYGDRSSGSGSVHPAATTG